MDMEKKRGQWGLVAARRAWQSKELGAAGEPAPR